MHHWLLRIAIITLAHFALVLIRRLFRQANKHPEPELEYVTLPRPVWDFRREKDDEEIDMMSEEEHEKMREEALAMLKKPIAQHPEWVWIISKKAYMLLAKYTKQAEKRNQDWFQMHIYNDWNGYGLLEVIENMLSAFNDEFRSDDRSAARLWAHVEAMTHWFCETDLMGLYHIDDGRYQASALSMVGHATLTALNLLERDGLLSPDSPVRSLSLVLTAHFEWIPGFEDAILYDNQSWPAQIIACAEAHRIPAASVHDILETLLTYKDENVKMPARKRPDRWGWGTKWQKYVKTNGKQGEVGGSYYDITKMSSAERTKHSFVGQDPMLDIDPPDSNSDTEWETDRSVENDMQQEEKVGRPEGGGA